MQYQQRWDESEAGYTALIRAAKEGKREAVASLLEGNEDPDERDIHGTRPSRSVRLCGLA